MTLTVEFWTLAGLVITGLGTVIGLVWKLLGGLLDQAIKRIDDHFSALEAAQKAAGSDLMRQLGAIEQTVRELERDFLQFKANLPLGYVLKADYLAAMNEISKKLDALGTRIEKILLRGSGGN